MSAGVDLLRADNVVLNVAMISAWHLDGEKLFVHYAGGRIWSFSGEQRDRLWRRLTAEASDVMQEPAAVRR